MIIRYSDGHVSEAVLLSRTEHSLRVAIRGAEHHVTEFQETNGFWTSEDDAVVQIEFGFARVSRPAGESLEDYICSPQLASKLVAMLHSTARQREPQANEIVTQSTESRQRARCNAAAVV